MPNKVWYNLHFFPIIKYFFPRSERLKIASAPIEEYTEEDLKVFAEELTRLLSTQYRPINGARFKSAEEELDALLKYTKRLDPWRPYLLNIIKNKRKEYNLP